MTSYFTVDELKTIGFKSVGVDVLISRKASIYRPECISLGDHVRVDDYCLLSGGSGIEIGNYVHISAYAALYGGGGIVLGNFSGLSPRATVFSESDDFSGKSLISPFFPRELKPGYQSGLVRIGRFVQVGASSTIMPGLELEEGVAIGAHSLVVKSCAAWGIYAGVPAQHKKERSRDVLSLAKKHIQSSAGPHNVR